MDIVVDLDIPVMSYDLKNNFKGNNFLESDDFL